VRRALFFREVVERYRLEVLDGELIVGSYFNSLRRRTQG
jgi:hypothetical protein